MGTKWTPAQEEAITTRGRDLLVAAAAGSGKTAVLVERIIRRVTDPIHPVDVDKLLVVTFTKAAASEMKERVAAALEAALAETPSAYLERQVALLPRAKLMTIDALCLELVREHAVSLGLDPAFRVADPGETALLREEVLDAVFEEAYAAADNGGFLALVETFAPGKTDRPLRDLTLTAYDFCQSHPFPFVWLRQAVEKCRLRTEVPFRETFWGWRLWQETDRILSDLEELCALAQEVAPTGYLPTLLEDREVLTRLRQANHADAFYDAIQTAALPRLGRLKKDDDPTAAELVKGYREQIRNGLKELREQLYFKPPGEMKSEFLVLSPLFLSLEQLLLNFDTAFRTAKREKSLEDFNDLEHDALRILLEPESTEKRIVPTRTAQELRERFEEVLCDEYQDSNLVQEYLLAALSRGDNRFLVGDVKQSIYRFRLARPELFLEKYRNFNGVTGLRIDLSQNFRSRENVLACTNLLFSQLMDDFLGEVTYDDAAALHSGAAYPELPQEAAAMQVLLVDAGQAEADADAGLAELSGQELEAEVIAQALQKLLDPADPALVYDRAEDRMRPCRYSDIVILLRSPKSWGDTLVQALSSAGIPAFAEGQGAYYDTVEVLTVLALLQVIDNPRQDIPLLTVLHSPLFGFSSERLLDVKTQGEALEFYDCLLALAQEPDIAAFLERLTGWRGAACKLTVTELLWKLYRETGYFDYLGATPMGALRQANLRLLLEKAAAWEAAGIQSLFAFVRAMDRLSRQQPSVPGAAALPPCADMVRILSIHRSKGLEFPVVVIGGLGKKINRKDLQAPLLFHQAMGLGADVTNLTDRVRTRGISKTLLARSISRENLSEELRVLYVAMTRAKEHLILTGSMNYLSAAQKRWALAGNAPLLPRRLRATASCYLDWIMPALSRPDGTACYRLHILSREEVAAPGEEKQPPAPNFYWDAEKDFSGYRAAVKARLTYAYLYPKAADLPAGLSVSEIKRLQYRRESLGDAELLQSVDWPEPDFYREKTPVSGARRGTALHTLLEDLDMHAVPDLSALEAAVARQVAVGRLTEEEAAAIPKEKVLRFLTSDIGTRLRASRQVVREQPFTLLVTPEEIFGAAYTGVKEELLLRGIIDCYFLENNQWVLLDYKTDRAAAEEIRSRYAVQIRLYRKALEQITGKKVAEAWLYLFHTDTAIQV